jgi:hypothetical protein
MNCVAEPAPKRRIYDAAMLRRAATIVAGSCLLLAACGGSGSDGDASTTTGSPTTTAATTTSTTATTAPPATTEAPATTLDTEDQLAAAEQAYLDAFDAYIAAARDPSNPDLRAEIERLYTGPSLEFTISQLDSFVEQNWVARPGDEPSRTIILLAPQSIPGFVDLVELVACEINSEVFVELGAAPDGSDSLVTDEVTVRRGLIRMRNVEGQWKADSGETLAELSTPDECQP